MWLRRSLVLVLAVAFVAGCNDSGSKSYSVQEVADALRAHGFANAAVSSHPQESPGLLLRGPERSAKVVMGVRPRYRYPPGGGSSIGDVTVAALIFDTQDEAACGDSNVIGTCLQKRNVVLLVRDGREQAARETLKDLD